MQVWGKCMQVYARGTRHSDETWWVVVDLPYDIPPRHVHTFPKHRLPSRACNQTDPGTHAFRTSPRGAVWRAWGCTKGVKSSAVQALKHSLCGSAPHVIASTNSGRRKKWQKVMESDK
eukprot:6968957-Prymnesium_polylepis.1